MKELGIGGNIDDIEGKQYQFQTLEEIFTHEFREYLGVLIYATEYVEKDTAGQNNEKICKMIQGAMGKNTDAQCILALSKTLVKSVKKNTESLEVMEQIFDVVSKGISDIDKVK